jgi:hypothetical protein
MVAQHCRLSTLGSADAAIKLLDQQHWVIEALETTGGNPYGVFVSKTSATCATN